MMNDQSAFRIGLAYDFSRLDVTYNHEFLDHFLGRESFVHKAFYWPSRFISYELQLLILENIEDYSF